MATQPGPINGTPRAEVDLTPALVANLLAQQHPDLAHLPLVPASEGWDNVMFRLGDTLAVRLPRRAFAAKLAGHEHTWLPRLAQHLTLPVPTPLRIGRPTEGYPWAWSVVPWLSGEPAARKWPATSEAGKWGRFLRSLHLPAPDDAPLNPFRGCPLQERDDAFKKRLQRISSRTDLLTPNVIQIWEAGLNAPLDGTATWLHGDLHPANVLVNQGTISGVIDWGDITSGDPATDLASIWMLFGEPQSHEDTLSAYGRVSEATLRRAKAWAVHFGVMFLETGLADNPSSEELGKTILQRFS